MALRIDIADDTLPKHYTLDYGSGIPTSLHGKVTLLVDENDNVKSLINRDFGFEVHSSGYYGNGNKVTYNRYLQLPRDLVSDFAINVGDGIELVLNEVVVGNETEKIFSQRRIEGSMDFEPKGFSGEVMNGSETLITTRFADEFYDNLALEINSAFRIRLLTATIVLIRKLFENLIIDLLRLKYGERPPYKELYYSMKDKRFHSFSTLIRNFEQHVDDFKAFNVRFQWDRSKNDFFNFLRDIKERGDACAHSIELIHDPKGINTLELPMNKYSDLFVRLIQRVKETPHNP